MHIDKIRPFPKYIWTILYFLLLQGGQNGFTGPPVGLFPSIFNLAEGANIHSNATCGDHSSEVFCKLELNSYRLPPSSHECAVCDLTEPSKAHPIQAAIDGDETWWQAPSLQFGADYHFVTITLDFKKVRNVGLDIAIL